MLVVDEDADRLVELILADGPIDLDVEGADPSSPDLDGIEVLVASPTVAASLVGSMADVRFIQSTWAGVDALAGLVPPGVTVARIGGVFGGQMCEFVFGHLLARSQRIVSRLNARRWDPTPPDRLQGSTLGVLGMGSIGSAIARAGDTFGMRVRGCSRLGDAFPGVDMFPITALESFLRGVDHLVVVLPSTSETRGLVDESAIDRLEPGATLINVGRGDTVEVDAVVEALGRNHLSLAVLDVLPDEPLREGDPLWEVDGLVITSHVAAVSHPEDVAPVIRDNLVRWSKGMEPRWKVDPTSGY